jgi:hypothetical protein
VQRYRDTLEQLVHAEALGFESVWPVEQQFNADLSITPAPLLLLAALAERTHTLRLGIAIVLLPLSHPFFTRTTSSTSRPRRPRGAQVHGSLRRGFLRSKVELSRPFDFRQC